MCCRSRLCAPFWARPCRPRRSRNPRQPMGTSRGRSATRAAAVLPGVTVTVTNTDTGAQRVVVTNEGGIYRAVLLPLGTYTVSAELPGFKRYEQKGLPLSAGQSVVVDIPMAVGGLTEVVSVSGERPVVDTAKIDLGRNLGEREVKNLPLVSRNPYNFALVQPGVTGFENPEFGVPRFAANGTLLAHQLSDRRQYQHAKGPRRSAAPAGVRSNGPGSQGRDERLRAGVRPDDGAGIQRHHAVGHQHLQGVGELPLPPQGFQRVPVSVPGQHAAHRRQQAGHARSIRGRRNSAAPW